ncbi:Phr family secreted Rap phosphatase inhibitor [Bacillus cereus]|nr:Phr family secreted Rap phosphatase inhibitor [Bacillus cereus]MEB8675377.1 Phr family secreted Rap phosphatase inhibitor [Bacillus cereus]
MKKVIVGVMSLLLVGFVLNGVDSPSHVEAKETNTNIILYTHGEPWG